MMTNKFNQVKFLVLKIAMNVANLTISRLVNSVAELNFQAKDCVSYLQRGLSVLVLFGSVIPVIISAETNAQSTLPEITIEANIFKDRDTEGHSYFLIADQKLTEDLTVNYEIVLDTGNLTTKEATIRKAHLTFSETHTESRINVTESHSEVRLTSGTGYTLGNSISAVKIDQPVETTASEPGIQIKFRQTTVNEGNHATLLARSTPAPLRTGNDFLRLDLLFKVDDEDYFNVKTQTPQLFFLERDVVKVGAQTGYNFIGEYIEIGYMFPVNNDIMLDRTLSVRTEAIYTFVNRMSSLRSIKTTSGSNETSIRILDKNVTPVIRISSTTEAVNEGENFPVVISAIRAPKPGTNIEVELLANDNDSGFLSSLNAINNRVTLTTNEPTRIIMVNTNILPGLQSGGVIEVSLVENPDFTIEPENGKVSVNVFDTDAIEVSIRTDTPNITEGQAANFMITTEQPSSIDLDIIISIDDIASKNFFTWRVPKSVKLSAGMLEAEFSIMTGTQADSRGNFSVSIAHGFGYRAVAPFVATVTVEADSDPVTTGERISVADLAVENILLTINSAPPANQNVATILPIISVVATSHSVEEGLPVEFALISQPVVPEDLRISISITGPNELIIQEINRDIVLQANQSQTRFSIPTIDNDKATDESRHVKVSINPDSRYIPGLDSSASVTITDHVDQQRRRNELESANHEVLTELYQNIGVSSWSNVSNQIELAFAGKHNSSIILGGQDTINGILTTNVTALDEDTWSLQSLMENSSFTLNLNPDDQGNRLGTVWGLGQQHTFTQNGNNTTTSWNGDLFTAQFGSDIQLDDNGIAGLSISVSDSTIEFGNKSSSEIQYDFNDNYLQTYLGWQFPDQNAEIQATTGIGFGDVVLKQDDYSPLFLNSSSFSVATSGNILLYSSPKSSGQITNSISLVGDSYISQISVSDTSKFLKDQQFNFGWSQLGIDVSNKFDIRQGSSLQIQSIIYGRTDFEDYESHLGLVYQSGITYSDPLGISASGTAQYLWHQNQHEFENFGIQGTLNFDLNNDKLGILVSLVPSWNFNQQHPFDNILVDQRVGKHISKFDQIESDTSLYSEVGYGIEFATHQSTLTPYSRIELNDSGNHAYRLGSKFKVGHGFTLAVENSYNLLANEINENKVKLSSRLQW